jgi:ubiquinone/menaquinone biosynthesis C-methylase UbiE
MATKDLFSSQSKAYAAFRPTYPRALYEFILRRVKHRDTAWDCATGNGQVARDLSKHFKKVFATDISKQQLDEAFQASNINYSVSEAEQTPFDDHCFDLITVGQALHWIDTDKFYREAKRVGKKGATIAIWGYSLLTVNTEIDKLFNDFYFNKVGKYWDAARKLVESEYATIDFPFAEKEEAKFQIKTTWTFEQFAGYLTSWSATQKFIKTEGHTPVPDFMDSIRVLWPDTELKEIQFPVFLKTGTIG